MSSPCGYGKLDPSLCYCGFCYKLWTEQLPQIRLLGGGLVSEKWQRRVRKMRRQLAMLLRTAAVLEEDVQLGYRL
ncbi:MAG: hypothetical protein WCJ35_00440 [Planctomycetota bacterium]